ncbi:MAG: hypothetical protein J7K02_06350, partial [Deltaproteobacteria bacterium]|nr:hypothetical protein [Deltaproteobacteria bacterium]
YIPFFPCGINGGQVLPYVILGGLEERESLIIYNFPALGILGHQIQLYISFQSIQELCKASDTGVAIKLSNYG